MGIAASSTILALQEKNQLAGVVLPQALQQGTTSLTAAQAAAVRQTFADAFTTDMKVSAIVAGVGLLLATGTYRSKRLTIAEMREERVRLGEGAPAGFSPPSSGRGLGVEAFYISGPILYSGIRVFPRVSVCLGPEPGLTASCCGS